MIDDDHLPVSLSIIYHGKSSKYLHLDHIAPFGYIPQFPLLFILNNWMKGGLCINLHFCICPPRHFYNDIECVSFAIGNERNIMERRDWSIRILDENLVCVSILFSPLLCRVGVYGHSAACTGTETDLTTTRVRA